jgi:Domain of unknown function (DUF4402)
MASAKTYANAMKDSLPVRKSAGYIVFPVLGLGIAALSMAPQNSAASHSSILKTITISEIVPMNFGTVILGTFGVTKIVLSTNGTVSGANVTSTGSPSAGEFRVYGTHKEAVTITLSQMTDPNTSGGDSLLLDSFTHNLGDTPSFNRRGYLTLKVGATLTTNTRPKGGYYSGQYAIIVNYN